MKLQSLLTNNLPFGLKYRWQTVAFKLKMALSYGAALVGRL